MARIAGLIAPDARGLLGPMIGALAAGAAVAPSQRFALSPRVGIALGATTYSLHPAWHDAADVTVLLDGGAQHDPRIVADLYRQHGFEGALQRLVGDFAIALHDRQDGSLWLGRDRLGVRPLYYADRLGRFAFASRPRPLIALPGVGSAINIRWAAVFAASHYRYIDNAPDESPYARIAQLPAAHWLHWSHGQVRTGCYWTMNDEADWDAPVEELADRYRELLLDAVDRRVRLATRPAFTLSGGMDSSTVLACAAKRLGASQDAFSTVYSDRTYDESDEIKPMLTQAVSHWYPIRVDDPDVFPQVRRMVDVNDEPVATATWLSHFVLCEAAAKAGVGTLFGGLGGDELNAGEYEYFFYYFADLARAGRQAEYHHEVERWVAHHDHPIYRKSAEVAATVIARCTDPTHPGRCLPDQSRLRRYEASIHPDFYRLDRFIPVMDAPFASYLKSRTFQDLTHETAPCCLRAEDRQTQAFGIDNQVPFFDHRLIEFMFRVPGALKIRDGVTKRLLREATKEILPDETRTRVKKTGWNAPAHIWFTGRALNDLQDLVHSRAFRERGMYSVDAVVAIIEEHRAIVASGDLRENHMMFLWQLVNLETWLQALETPEFSQPASISR